jgi:hypothetical protein
MADEERQWRMDDQKEWEQKIHQGVQFKDIQDPLQQCCLCYTF